MSNEAPTDALRLVPVEPTEKMLAQGKHAYAMTHEDDALRGAWAVMLAAAPASPLPGGEWQDISTAPKDGTLIIAGHSSYADGIMDCVLWDGGRWATQEGVGYLNGRFTHWMPLPAAPTGAK